MNPEPVRLAPLTVAQARAIDRDAVERLGMPSALLMENAARGLADEVRRLGAPHDRPAVFLCGPGNNGGDGLAAARHLVPPTVGPAGLSRVHVHLLAEPDDARAPDAALQLRILRAAGWEVTVGAAPDPEAPALRDAVWVDALFGTGLTRAVAGDAARWIEVFERAAGPKVCVDIPSGLDGDSGQPLGPTCRGDVTVTFAAPKVGLLAAAAAPFVGRVAVVPLGIPASLLLG